MMFFNVSSIYYLRQKELWYASFCSLFVYARNVFLKKYDFRCSSSVPNFTINFWEEGQYSNYSSAVPWLEINQNKMAAYRIGLHSLCAF